MDDLDTTAEKAVEDALWGGHRTVGNIARNLTSENSKSEESSTPPQKRTAKEVFGEVLTSKGDFSSDGVTTLRHRAHEAVDEINQKIAGLRAAIKEREAEFEEESDTLRRNFDYDRAQLAEQMHYACIYLQAAQNLESGLSGADTTQTTATTKKATTTRKPAGKRTTTKKTATKQAGTNSETEQNESGDAGKTAGT